MNHGEAMTCSSQSYFSRFARACSMVRSGFSLRPAYFCARRSPASRGWRDRTPSALVAEQARDDVHGTRRVEHVDDGPAVLVRDLHRGVLRTGRRAADEQRHREPAPLHLARHEHHLVERRRDQSAEADDVHLLLDRGRRGSSPPAPSRRGRSPRSCCTRARRRRCSCRCRGRHP